MLDFLFHLTFAKVRLILEATDRLGLPPYKGSTFRGAFGHAFRKVACAARRADCVTCMLRSSCLYVRVFNTPVPEGARFTGSEAPHHNLPEGTDPQPLQRLLAFPSADLEASAAFTPDFRGAFEITQKLNQSSSAVYYKPVNG